MSLTTQETVLRPAIAILTMPDEQRFFRGNSANFIDLIETGKELGMFVYVLTTTDLKLGNAKLIGYVYNAEDNTWVRSLVPRPRVIYNRIPTRQDELEPETHQAILNSLKHPSIRLFNPFFFDKWSLFEWLGRSKAMSQFIPATGKLTSVKELGMFLKLYPVIFLKPVGGKAGKGIMKVERVLGTETGTYRLSIQSKKGSRIYSYSTLVGLWNEIKKSIGEEPYIIQQGIRLVRAGNRPFDLRVLVQKNRKGEWKLTGMGARVAGKSSITTHVPCGGYIEEPGKVLTSAFGGLKSPLILKKAQMNALKIARHIEKVSGYSLGEMSMDLGIDVDGRIWFFEANSRPMKFDEPDIRKRSLERIIQYSLYLSKSDKKSR